MTTVNNGGPAFPLLGDGPNAPCFNEGMTLRDYFAGQALKSCSSGDYQYWRDLADDCYAIADAMLASKEKNRG